jgi:FkbM family methyltransferase
VSDFYDELLSFCGTRKYRKIFLYGAGLVGQCAADILACSGVKIDGFLYSDDHSAPMNLPVGAAPAFRLSQLDVAEDFGVVITSRPGNHEVIRENLRRRGVKNIFPETTPDDYMYQLTEKYVDEIIELATVNSGGDDVKTSQVLTIGAYRLPNLFNELAGQRWDFAFALQDVIFPAAGIPYATVEGPYELDGVSVDPGDIVFDAGANFGMFSALAATRGGKVFAFEPSGHNRGILSLTQELYPESIEIVPFAVSDSVGEVRFTDDAISGSNRIAAASELGTTVKTVTFDSFAEENGIKRVDFIKADIEGAERLMLRGSGKILRDSAPKLAICTYHYPDDPEVLEKLILQANPRYTVRHKWKKLFAYV